MVVRLSDPSLAEKFLGYLRRAECIARLGEVDAHAVGVAVEVEVPAAYDEEQARLEVGLYLRVWEAVHAGTEVHLLD
jgi:chloramphenicol 3-O-phosphotransferase